MEIARHCSNEQMLSFDDELNVVSGEVIVDIPSRNLVMPRQPKDREEGKNQKTLCAAEGVDCPTLCGEYLFIGVSLGHPEILLFLLSKESIEPEYLQTIIYHFED